MHQRRDDKEHRRSNNELKNNIINEFRADEEQTI